MRQLVVTVPADRSDEVCRVLYEECCLQGVSRHTQDGISTILALVSAHVAGYCMYNLDLIGVGVAYGQIALLPVTVRKPLPRGSTQAQDKAQQWKAKVAMGGPSQGDRNSPPKDSALPTTAERESRQSKVSRLAVEEIYTCVVDGAQLSIDYVLYILVAGMIAAVGLATNNAVMIVASMLVSPLMGPILGFTFGTAIFDWALVQASLMTEAVGMLVTTLVGFVVGLVVSGWPAVTEYYDWPTEEMASRGSKSGLLVGLFFALPSGVGVALSATQGGVNSLVGVAIAASLLPPLVNVGMCLGYAAAGANQQAADNPSLNFDAQTFLDIAGTSLALFLINIACIFSMSLLVFWMKKIKPVRRQLLKYQDLPRIPLPPPPGSTPTPLSPAPSKVPGSHHAPLSGSAAGARASVEHPGPAHVHVRAVKAMSTDSAQIHRPAPSGARSSVDTSVPPPPSRSATDAEGASGHSEPPEAAAAVVPGVAAAPPPDVPHDTESDDQVLDTWAARVAPTASILIAHRLRTASIGAPPGGLVADSVQAAVAQWVAEQRHVLEMRAAWKNMLHELRRREAAVVAAAIREEEGYRGTAKGWLWRRQREVREGGAALENVLNRLDDHFQVFIGKVKDQIVSGGLLTQQLDPTAPPITPEQELAVGTQTLLPSGDSALAPAPAPTTQSAPELTTPVQLSFATLPVRSASVNAHQAWQRLRRTVLTNKDNVVPE